MSNSNDTTSIDNILDATLDDLADLPEFLPFPPGLHRCTLNFESKKIGTHPAVSVKLTLLETIELANTDDQPLASGATTDVGYMMDNQYGQGAFKKLAAAIQPTYPDARTLGALIKEANGVECNVITKQRPNKDKSQYYTDIVEVQVV